MISEETRKALKDKYRDRLRLVTIANGQFELVFTSPSRAEYDAWIDEKKSSQASRVMCKACCVYPDDNGQTFMQAIDTYPATLLNGIIDSVIELAGIGAAQVNSF
jgi:hypothetical protein